MSDLEETGQMDHDGSSHISSWRLHTVGATQRSLWNNWKMSFKNWVLKQKTGGVQTFGDGVIISKDQLTNLAPAAQASERRREEAPNSGWEPFADMLTNISFLDLKKNFIDLSEEGPIGHDKLDELRTKSPAPVMGSGAQLRLNKPFLEDMLAAAKAVLRTQVDAGLSADSLQEAVDALGFAAVSAMLVCLNEERF